MCCFSPPPSTDARPVLNMAVSGELIPSGSEGLADIAKFVDPKGESSASSLRSGNNRSVSSPPSPRRNSSRSNNRPLDGGSSSSYNVLSSDLAYILGPKKADAFAPVVPIMGSLSSSSVSNTSSNSSKSYAEVAGSSVSPKASAQVTTKQSNEGKSKFVKRPNVSGQAKTQSASTPFRH